MSIATAQMASTSHRRGESGGGERNERGTDKEFGGEEMKGVKCFYCDRLALKLCDGKVGEKVCSRGFRSYKTNEIK